MEYYNIGIATGASNLVVIDLDEDNAKGKHGIQTLVEWKNNMEFYPTLFVVVHREAESIYISKSRNISSVKQIYILQLIFAQKVVMS